MNLALLLKVFGVFGIAAAGSGLALVARRGWLGSWMVGFDLTKFVARWAFGLFIPALMFRSIATLDLATLPRPLLVAYFVPALVYLVCVYTGARRLAAPHEHPAAPATRAVAATYGNAVQLGIPLAAAVFGGSGLALHVALVSVHGLLLLVLATTLVELDLARHAGGHGLARTLLQTLRNTILHPLLLPVMAGFVWNLTGLGLHPVVDAVLQALGAVAVPLCLLSTGLALVSYGLQRDRRTLHAALLLSALKLVVMPAIVLAAAAWIFGLHGQALAVLVMMAATPVGANPLIFALRYGCQQAETTLAIVISTLVFVLSAPLWLWLLQASA